MKTENQKTTSIEHIRLCKRCIGAIKSRGEIVYVGPEIERELETIGEDWYISDELTCEWCKEEDEELYDCHF